MGDIADAVRAERATELERLGSDRGLIALTDADLSGETIRDRLAGVLLGLAEVYDRWDTEPFGAAATTARELAGALSDLSTIEPASGQPVVDQLDTLEGTDERIGAGLVATPMVLDGWALQGVSFFVNEADEASADRFREVRTGLDDLVARGEEAHEQEATAKAAANDIVSVAYDDYVETLDGLGLDPKTVC